MRRISLLVIGRISLVLVAVMALAAPAGADARLAGDRLLSPLADPEHDCAEPVPEAMSIPGTTDDGSVVSIETLVLLDGVSKKVGQSIMQLAQESYDSLGLTVTPSFRQVRIPHHGIELGMDDRPGPTGDMLAMIEDAKVAVGGVRPAGIDVVLLLTSKDIFYWSNGERQYSVAGLADCIGGIRFDDHAFALSEGITPWAERIGDHAPGMFVAHELGHLLGAHHHYANCLEGNEEDKPCTVMWTIQIRLVARNFGSFEAATIRGHAVEYADR